MLYKQLRELAAELAEPGEDPSYTFDTAGVGLILIDEEGHEGYDSTPLNADTFARTGGDGVHYSFLHDTERSDGNYPIVMTVPMADEESTNCVVGENLHEFLALGYWTGYFGIEQLAYFYERTVAELSGEPARAPDRLRGALIARFGLTPWENVAARLAELKRRFGPLIRRADLD